MKSVKSERLPDRANFIEWYNSALDLAEVVDRRYPIKGTFVWLPYGLRMMKRIVAYLDKEFTKCGIEEVYFPLFVPIEYAKINEKWLNSFKDEAYYVNDKEALLRPTGEPAMYPMFKLWMKKGKLPIRIYETVDSFRKESKTTHAMIRDRQITFWHEIHTVHKTREEANEEASKHLDIYKRLWTHVFNIPPIIVTKPKYEVFAGAEFAYEFYAMLPDGRMLEVGSINNLGQAYAKKYDLSYANEKGEQEYVWQICTGCGERFLSTVIAVHGDDKGLVIPPQVAPIKAVIIPIFKAGGEEIVKKEAEALLVRFTEAGIDAYVDNTQATPGEKFNVWELKGVPIRIELGEKEVKEGFYTMVRRDQNKKYKIEKAKITETINSLLSKEIPENMAAKVTEAYNGKIVFASSMEQTKALINEGKVVKANWCEEKPCYDAIAEIAASFYTEAIGTLISEEKEGKCIVCGKKTSKLAMIGKTY